MSRRFKMFTAGAVAIGAGASSVFATAGAYTLPTVIDASALSTEFTNGAAPVVLIGVSAALGFTALIVVLRVLGRKGAKLGAKV